MNRTQKQSSVSKILTILFSITVLVGATQCERRIEAKPGGFERTTQGRGSANRKVIVFVHGFTGDRDETWTYSEGGVSVYWPRLLSTDPDLMEFDVYVASYVSKALKPGKTIHELASDLNFEMQQQGLFQNYDKIYFVAHSMGNLIVREAMLEQSIHNNVRVPLVVAYGAPTHGSEIADACARVLSNQQCKDMIPEDNNTWLQATNDRWRSMYSDVETACAYETLDALGVGGRVVARGNATSFCTRMPPKAIGANHSGMVKPKGIGDEIHVWLRAQLLAKPERSSPYRVVLVDSGAGKLVYSSGKSSGKTPEGHRNMHAIKTALSGKEFPFNIDLVPIFDGWTDYDEVLKHRPELVIVHFSSLYGETALGDPEGRLGRFLLTALRDSKAKIIVYSRWDENHVLAGGTRLGRMQDFLIRSVGSEGTHYESRVAAFDVNAFNVRSPDFSDAVVVDQLRSRVRKVLDLPGTTN